MKLYGTAESIIAEIEAMENAEFFRREDRATVSAFFNGEAPLSDEEAEDMGFKVNVNNLLGYTEVKGAKQQLFSLYTKPTKRFSVTLDSCPAHCRQKWEMESTDAGNELVSRTGRLKPAYEGVSGDAGLHGTGVFFFPNSTDWCPSQSSLSRLLIPDDAPVDRTRQTHWAIEGELSLRECHNYIRLKAPGWNLANLKAKLDLIYSDVTNSSTPVDWQDYNPEEIEYRRQANSAQGHRRRPSIKVVYFFQVRSDQPSAPVDMTILLHKSEVMQSTKPNTPAKDKVLYEKDAAYEGIDSCLHPFHMDCILGGVPMWHRVLGLGHLNYQLNHAVELLINRAMEGTLEGMMNLWQAKDGASRDQIQQILLKHNGVIPENISLISERFKPDLDGALSMIQFFRQQGSKNAGQAMPNNGDSNDMLHAQFMAQQDQAAQQVSSTASNWYDNLDRLFSQIWARLVNPFIMPCDSGYSEILKFQSRMERLGIPLYYLQPHNVHVTATRIVGDGNTQQEQQAAIYLTQNRAMYPPNAQQEITRMATAVMTGSYELAERLVPLEQHPDKSQIRIASGESSDAMIQGQPPTVDDTDIDEVHVPVHMQAMTGIAQKAAQFQNATFTPDQHLGFKALGAHIVMHIHKKESMAGAGKGDQNKQLSAQWMQQLNEIVSVGEKLAHNLEQQQQSQGGEKPDPTDVAKIQLAVKQLELQQQKFEFSREKFDKQQAHKEGTAAFNQAVELQRQHRETMLTRSKITAADVSSATKLNPPAKPAAPARAE